MTLIPELEDRLTAAARERAGGARRRWSPRRMSGRATVAALGIAVPAVAATKPWEPLLGRPELNGPTRASADGVPAAQLRDFAVLRRAQTERDRTVGQLGLLKDLGPSTDGVRTGAIRLLTPPKAPMPVALIPVASIDYEHPDLPDKTPMRNVLCLADREAVECSDDKTNMTPPGAYRSPSPYVYGIVPDGVVAVRIDFKDGETRRLEVRDNFYSAEFPDKMPTFTVPAAGRRFGMSGAPSTDPGPTRWGEATMTWEK